LASLFCRIDIGKNALAERKAANQLTQNGDLPTIFLRQLVSIYSRMLSGFADPAIFPGH
jgi:hypothetical protein